MKAFFLSLTVFFAAASLFAESLFLINDSPFELTAIVQAADGSFLAQLSLQPGEQSQWTTDVGRTEFEVDDNSSTSLTPFIVTWRCAYEGYYTVCTDIPPGATVSANACDGGKFCKPKEKKEKEECPPCPDGESEEENSPKPTTAAPKS